MQEAQWNDLVEQIMNTNTYTPVKAGMGTHIFRVSELNTTSEKVDNAAMGTFLQWVLFCNGFFDNAAMASSTGTAIAVSLALVVCNSNR